MYYCAKGGVYAMRVLKWAEGAVVWKIVEVGRQRLR